MSDERKVFRIEYEITYRGSYILDAPAEDMENADDADILNDFIEFQLYEEAKAHKRKVGEDSLENIDIDIKFKDITEEQ